MTALTADSEAFAAAILRVARFLPETLSGRLPPTCKGILLAARRGALEIVATNLEATGHGRIPADVAAPGRVLLDGVRLARVAGHLPAPRTAIALEGMHVAITSGPARWRLITLPDEDFPTELPSGTDLNMVKPVAPDKHQRELVRRGTSRDRARRAARPRRAADLYAPTGLEVGAWITWTRETSDGTQTVTGQVWSAAPGAHAVWALAEGETAPAYVRPSYSAQRGHHPAPLCLTEFPPPATAPSGRSS
ncbi:hypothetical protein ACFOY4_01670 [Actinomadura syzygii]|uniref:DNA polymerase III beta sliding clamp N-terminal domain-containing protein n=1 Tax=Actinomadura syzygii TaxID=1427538 RepID=A0A5D0TSY2_9ACTN|nr:hypothetical protein [Actinomadura syzygii]TYC08550.1 hypothetical protein FXF65_37275 [Actinomadura syzygii]